MVKNSPDWVSESVFYHIYPLGYCVSGDYDGNFSRNNLSRISENLTELKDMGFNAIYLGPVFQSENHGYDTSDYFKVDARLGSNGDMKEFIKSCHELDIRVILDGVFNHTGQDFFAFRELVNCGGYGEFESWYCDISHDHSAHGMPFTYGCWNGHRELPKLNLRNKNVKAYLFEAVKFWIDEFDIDGIRLDAADCLDFEFMKELRILTDKSKNDFWLMGEVIHGDYSNWANGGTLHSVTNYECYKGLYSSFNDSNFFEISYALNRQFGRGGLYENLQLYNFVDNHDVSRIYSLLNDKTDIHPLYVLLFTMPGTPSVYYGSEYGYEARKNSGSDWNLRPELRLITGNLSAEKRAIVSTVKKLIEIRKSYTPLKKGCYKQLHVDHKHFLFEREFYGDRIIIGINSEDMTHRGCLNSMADGMYFDILNGMREFKCENGRLNYEIYPNWGMILVKK